MGTLGKAYGSYDLYFNIKTNYRFLTNRAKPIIYSTSHLYLIALANESLDYIIENKDLLKKEEEKIMYY